MERMWRARAWGPAGLFLGIAFAGCTLPRSGGMRRTCTVELECLDQSPCTAESCGADGLCVIEPLDGPIDKGACVDARCARGLLEEAPVPDGTECTEGQGDGVCVSGVCVIECAADPTVCNDGNVCTHDSCDPASGTCVREVVDGAAPSGDPSGDCLLDLCVAGVLQPDVVDDSDVPDDMNPCTGDVCENGVEAHPYLEGPCGPDPLHCEDGVCVGCTSADECGTSTACVTHGCNDGHCSLTYAPEGTVDRSRSAPPCEEWRCDGSGSSDLVDAADGTACDDGAFCNGQDECLGGSCSWHGGDPCASNIGDGDADCSESCRESTDACTADDPALSPCSNGACDGMGACVSCGVDAPPTGQGCPSVCNGGCNGGLCTIECIGSNACKGKTRSCPSSFDCLVVCSGSQACRDLVVSCPPTDHSCSVNCTAVSSQLCRSLDLECSSDGSCQLACGSSDQCSSAVVDCGDDACAATCASSTEPTLQCGSSCGCSPC
jgi:hypothetical protein